MGGEIVTHHGKLCADVEAAPTLLADAAQHVASEAEALDGFHVPGKGLEV